MYLNIAVPFSPVSQTQASGCEKFQTNKVMLQKKKFFFSKYFFFVGGGGGGGGEEQLPFLPLCLSYGLV